MNTNVKNKMICSICGYPIEDGAGHNPWPIAELEHEGPCCDLCDDLVVGPAQIAVSGKLKELMDEAGMSRSEADSYLQDFINTEVMDAAKTDIEEAKYRQKAIRG